MQTRRSRPVTPRPQSSTSTNLALRSSTAGWYAEWKARKQATAAEPAPTPAPADTAAEAVAKWLTGG